MTVAEKKGRTTMTTLGPRPAANLISFASDCFAQDGEEVYYLVIQSALKSGPARFSDRAQADAFAAKRNRGVSEVRCPRMVRVRWF